MSLTRTILAALLAALMGAPLCCCAYESHSKSAEPQPSCCHASEPSNKSQKSPQDHICACRSKDPRESAKELKIPGNQVIELAPPVMEPIELVVLEPENLIAPRPVHTGSDPPTRLRLARLSRWLN